MPKSPKKERPKPGDPYLCSEFKRVTRHLQKLGVKYPAVYVDALLEKYSQIGVKYPRILMRVGAPNIRKHFRYAEILRIPRKLLDYGCGTIMVLLSKTFEQRGRILTFQFIFRYNFL